MPWLLQPGSSSKKDTSDSDIDGSPRPKRPLVPSPDKLMERATEVVALLVS